MGIGSKEAKGLRASPLEIREGGYNLTFLRVGTVSVGSLDVRVMHPAYSLNGRCLTF